MTAATFVLMSGTLSFGVPIAIALYELTQLRSSPKGGDGNGPPPKRWPPRPPKPLPDCLLPDRLLPGPAVIRDHPVTRALEDA